MTALRLRQLVVVAAARMQSLVTCWPGASAALAYLAITLVLVRDLVFQGRALCAGDFHLFWYTQAERFVRIVATPAWPVWDPYVSFGQPLLADPASQTLYPPTWLHLLAQPLTFYVLYLVAHLVLTGVGTFLLGRRLGLSALSAFLSGAIWMSSGALLSLANNPHHLAGAAWLPWVLLAAENAARAASLRTAVVCGCVAAGQVLAGSPDMCLLAVLGAAVICGRHLLCRDWRQNGRRVAAAALALVVAAGLSAALWVATFDVVSRSSRTALPAASRVRLSLHPMRLVEMLLPVRWQQLAADPTWATAVFENRDPFLYSLYLGLPTLALLFAALCTRERGLLRSLLLLTAVALLLAFGRHTPFYECATSLLPLAKAFRYPQKAMALALLSGVGCDAWRSRAGSDGAWVGRVAIPLGAVGLAGLAGLWMTTAAAGTIPAWLIAQVPRGGAYARVLPSLAPQVRVACGLLILCAGLAALRRHSRLAATSASLLAALTIVELARVEHGVNPTAPRALYRYRPPVLSRLSREDRLRLYVHDYSHVEGGARHYLGRANPYTPVRAPAGWSAFEAGALGTRDCLLPPVASLWGYESSYDIDPRGLYNNALAGLVALIRDTEGTPAYLRLLQLGAVRQVVALHTVGLEALAPAGAAEGVLPEPTRVYRVPEPLPRVYAVSGVRVASGSASLETITDARFDPRHEVVLPTGTALPPDPEFTSTCRIVEFLPDRVRIDASLSGAGHLVLVDAYDTGWKVTVDGQAAALRRANVAFRAVAVPGGRHEVVFVYRPTALMWGLVISLTTVAGVVAGAAVGRWRRARQPCAV